LQISLPISRNLPTPSVVAQSSGRLKETYVPIDVFSYQQNAGFSPFSPISSQSSSTKSGTRSLCNQAGALRPFVSDFLGRVDERLCARAVDDDLDFLRSSERPRIRYHIPDITGVFGKPSKCYPNLHLAFS